MQPISRLANAWMYTQLWQRKRLPRLHICGLLTVAAAIGSPASFEVNAELPSATALQ
jgi:hypothetical protein